MTSVPTLTTDRLILRAPEVRDLTAFEAFCASPGSTMLGGPYEPIQAWRIFAGAIGHWTLCGFGRWIVTWKDREDAIGLVGLHQPADWPEPEIAWTVWGDGLGKGVAQEAAIASRNHAFGVLGWLTAISSCAPDNPRSARVAERIGARRDGSWIHPEFGPFNIWRHDKAAA